MKTTQEHQIATTKNGSTDSVHDATILVVDDELINRAMLCRLLQSKGYATQEAENGAAALEAIQSDEVDLVLLDIVMPNMDGFDVLQCIRADRSESDLPVIMVTASNESKQVVRALEAGANDYLTKPVDAAVTLARIGMHLRFKQSQEALKKSEERYSLVTRGTNDGLWDWDLTTDEVYYSPRWISMMGIEAPEQSSPRVWLDLIHLEDRERVETEIASHLSGITPQFETELRMRHGAGTYRWMLSRGIAVRDKDDKPYRMAGSLTDITEGKVADALTGLPNRVLFRERLDRCFARTKDDPDFQFALLYLDLDNFKLVNDSLGHESGDRLLGSVARRLESVMRSNDSFISRLGGDEFAIILMDIQSPAEAETVANRIISSVNAPISLGSGREIFASVSVGIGISWAGCKDPVEILQAADTAMYRAKAYGKSCYRVFDPVMREDATKRLEIESELRHAVERNELFLHYQPIVDIHDGCPVGFEALARWTHPRLGPISPADFIPIAEDTGLISQIGYQVLQKACRQMAAWRLVEPKFNDLQVSVNLSNRQLRDDGMIDQIEGLLAETNLRPEELRLEITESTIMENPEEGASILSGLRQRGVKVAIDDFGTGYSSLASIHNLSPDVVKIDRSFVDKLTTSIDKQTIVGAIIAVADGLGLDVVAEGVETEAQLRMLASMGCEYSQGFLFSRPLAADDLLEFIRRNPQIKIDEDKSKNEVATAFVD